MLSKIALKLATKVAEEAGETFLKRLAKQALEAAIITAAQNVAGMVSETLTALALQKAFGEEEMEEVELAEEAGADEEAGEDLDEIEPPGFEGDPDEEVLPQPEPEAPAKPKRKTK